ncbi:hypothetical protein AB1A64_19615 [Ruegeria sp. ANG10]|uniref:hypothetical protein n=1 Tax=Ruegeria sp. ANG10 TaxID=3042467 RepID=UPI003451FB8E
MINSFRSFLSHEDGAITVDWVVLTAVIAGFGTIVITSLGQPIDQMDVATGDALTSASAEVLTPDLNPGD